METKDRTLKTKNKVSVVVVTYNSSPVISACLISLTGNSPCKETIVIDNASSDQEICQRLAVRFPSVNFVTNQRNVGYGAAVNQGARLAKGEYLFFMNPDMVIPEGTIEELVVFMESHPDCGACSPYIKTPEKPWWYSWIVLRTPIGLAMGVTRKGRDFYNVKFLLGCAVLVKRDFFLQIGGFDEKFFLYYEDRDLGYRIRDKGKFNYVVFSAPVIHFYAKSSATLPIREKGEILAKSRWYFAKKHNLMALKIWCLIYTPIQRFLCWLVSWLKRV